MVRSLVLQHFNVAMIRFTQSIPTHCNHATPFTDAIIKAMFSLKNETLATRVRGYAAAVGTVMTEEEHNSMHNKVSEVSTANYPHSIFFHPVHERVRDYDSPIVAFIAGGVAWDRSLVRNVLPENVHGITTVIKNNCNQSYTYEINGKNPYYLGEGDFHDPVFDDMEVKVDLSPHSHADFDTTPGHCKFSLVSRSLIC